MMAGGCYLVYSHHKLAHAAWLLFWMGASLVVIFNTFSTIATITLLATGLLGIFLLRSFTHAADREKIARVSLLFAVIYICANSIASH